MTTVTQKPLTILTVNDGPFIHVVKRYRINVSTTVKGVKTFDCTVDIEGAAMEEVVAESDRLVALLDLRYPATESNAVKS